MRDSNRAVNRTIEPIVWSPKWYTILKWIPSGLPSNQQSWEEANAWPDIVRSLAKRRLQADATDEALDDLFACFVSDSKGQALNLSLGEQLAETSHLRK